MHIFIIGAGAIGKALAVLLQQAGKAVTLLRGSTNDVPAHTQQLQVTLADGQTITAEIRTQSLDHFTHLNGLIVLTSKSFGNERLAHLLRPKTGNAPLVILQNGLGVEQPFIREHFTAVYRCVLFVTSQVENTIRFKPVAPCPIGHIDGTPGLEDDIAALLDTPHFRFRGEKNIQPVIWKKAIINSVFNSVCPLLEVDNGIFHRNAEALNIARGIITECLAVAALQGVTLSPAAIEENLLQISRLSDGQLISTLQDIRRQRDTEIDTLNIAIARIAAEQGAEALVKATSLLGELTKLKSLQARQAI
ncbi:2-dehydropantoate 2-reductase [Chitinophaga horti]|uniref:2-dehydropantoate 2-reductase n=1 Tax=Chitinophaga horti TaxID=2920382 RepID=A0ABY6J807_9BACT|nr:2-dehydropantoate 2-reductase [Chitinophaga horti]UYQ95773.1 2-dehydropantoate 2-reductase [Chitinophaga horti]